MNNQFSIAVHILTALGFSPGEGVPSRSLATSVNANASFVRRIVAKLSKSGLIHSTTGKAGACSIGREPETITLLDIYKAVEAPKAFSIHHYVARKECTVSCRIKPSLEKVLDRTQNSLEASLKNVTLADVIADVRQAA